VLEDNLIVAGRYIYISGLYRWFQCGVFLLENVLSELSYSYILKMIICAALIQDFQEEWVSGWGVYDCGGVRGSMLIGRRLGSLPKGAGSNPVSPNNSIMNNLF
jgi:hypothetical protein